jgi:hypothetical protein
MADRSPYPHELNYEGTACAADCPACLWSMVGDQNAATVLMHRALARVAERSNGDVHIRLSGG